MNEICSKDMIMDWRLVFIHLLYSSILTTVFISLAPSLTIFLTWWFWHCTACTINSHVEGLEGSSMTWCIPLSVQYTLLSGWELGWPFRALLTQPFMSHSDSQTTTMTLPSSSSSASYSHCLPCSELSLASFVRVYCAYLYASACTMLVN